MILFGLLLCLLLLSQTVLAGFMIADSSLQHILHLKRAIKSGSEEKLGKVLRNFNSAPYNLKDKEEWESYAFKAVIGGPADKTHILYTLLEKGPFLDPAANDNEAIRLAVARGDLSSADILLKSGRVNPAAKANEAVKVAARMNDIKMLELLMADPRVDPTVDDNIAIRSAAQSGAADIVTQLLKDPRVDPGALDNAGFKLAIMTGKTNTAEILLKSGRLHPLFSNTLLNVPAEDGNAAILKLLVEEAGADPSFSDNSAIIVASERGKLDAVKYLLTDPRVDPSARDNLAFRMAAEKGRADIVELLLKDPRVDPTAMDDYAILKAGSYYGSYKVVQILLEDGRSNPAVQNNKILEDSLSPLYTTETRRTRKGKYIHSQKRSGVKNLKLAELLMKDPRVSSISFLKKNARTANPITPAEFLGMIDSPVQWMNKAYMAQILSFPSVSLLISQILQVSVEEASLIKTLEALNERMIAIHPTLVGNVDSSLTRYKKDFLWRYFAATRGFRDNRDRFQALTLDLISKWLTTN